MPLAATIMSLPVAFEMLKAMQAEDLAWGEVYRLAARQALAELLEGRMAATIDRHLEHIVERGETDRRNGCYRRWLLTELGRIELAVPRTRTFSALRVVQAYARRVHHVDRLILACFVLGFSTRKLDPRRRAALCRQRLGRDQADAAGARDRQRRTGALRRAPAAGARVARGRPARAGRGDARSRPGRDPDGVSAELRRPGRALDDSQHSAPDPPAAKKSP